MQHNAHKITISIGIPAYNEEANIKKLLLSLLLQKGNKFLLKEILVVSDASIDKTVDEVKSVKDGRVKLICNQTRLGQAAGQNKIVKLFSGDILILLNADVLPKNENFIEKLIAPFKHVTVGMTGPRIIPVKSSTYFEEIINYSIRLKESLFESWNNGDNVLICTGRGRAFRRNLAKKIEWKNALSEDAYSYLLCLSHGYAFKYARGAELLFKSPDNFKDHIKQSARFLSGPSVLSKYFPETFVKSSYSIPLINKLTVSFHYLLKEPVLFFSYLFVLARIKFTRNKNRYANSRWQMSTSSKILNKSI